MSSFPQTFSFFDDVYEHRWIFGFLKANTPASTLRHEGKTLNNAVVSTSKKEKYGGWLGVIVEIV